MKRILFLLISTLLLLPSTLAGEHILGGSLTEWNAFLEKVSESPLLLQNPAGVQLELTREDIEAYIEAKEVQGFLQHDLFIPSTEGITYLKLSIADTITQSIQTTEEEQSLTYPASDVRITPGNDLFTIEGDNAKGYALEEPYLLSSLEAFLIEAYHGNAQILEIPMEELEPEVLLIDGETETKLDIVAEGVSDFSGSTESRIHNIGVALARFNGYTIPKGETFSFNTQLGEVDGSTGYKKELVIKGPKTIPEYGGGVCQVSSTVYRAALDGGLPITERKAHSYAVSYYTPWGSDATIYPGIVDLQFVNDTPGDVIIHMYMEGKTLHANFYGTHDGRSVQLAGPNVYGYTAEPDPFVETVDYLAPGQRVIKEYGQGGFSAWWKRTITYPDGEQVEETIDTTYTGKKGIVLQGPSAAPEDSASESSSEG